MNAPARRRRIACALLASTVLLAGCGPVDAGTATSEAFVAYMADVPGVVAADGSMSNNLPFAASGDLEIELDASADEQTLDAALDHATAFPLPSGAQIDVDRLVTRVEGPVAHARIETLWGAETDGVAGRALAVLDVPGLSFYAEELEDLYGDDPSVATLSVRVSPDAADPCGVVSAVAEAVGAEAGSIEAAQGEGSRPEELSCS